MESDLQYKILFQILRSRFSDARCGIFCNHSSFIWKDKKYLVRELDRMIRLEKIFVPEHGFFAELQDQDPVIQLNSYDFLQTSAEVQSFYPGKNHQLDEALKSLDQLDLMIIDIQDVGSRYFTYVTMLGIFLKTLKDRSIHILLIDRPNPAGRQVEGIPLPDNYASLIGWPGLPHRYGLSIGELALFMKDQLKGKFNLEIIKKVDYPDLPDPPYPSPNMPHPRTPRVYTGQCLWEGTNVSEGRGTTRPFEIFGAPFFRKLVEHWADRWNQENQEVILRPMIFVPTFHKYQGLYCFGFQLHPVLADYHSLWYSLKVIRNVKSELKEFSWKEGAYESGSDLSAIELLAGDDLLIEYLNGKEKNKRVQEKLFEEERKWIDQCSRHLLYEDKLRQANI